MTDVNERSRIFREMCLKADTERDKGLTTPENIARFDDIPYGTDEKWQILDVYRPKSAEGEKLPVIVSIHGGGWVYGSKEIYQFYCMDLAQRGFVVVNFTYRLAPENRFPASLEDTNTVFAWIRDNAEKYGFDLGNVFAVGDSAGAFCLSVYACILTNSVLAAEFGKYFSPADVELKGIGLNCGLFTTADYDESLEAYLPKEPSEHAEVLRMLDAVSHITPDFPPAYILTANADFLVDAPAVLIPVLAKNGVKYESKVYGTNESPLFHVFHCDIKTEAATHANDDECGFFRGLM
ncbi:alpha/beta hydrolase [Ruminococcus albus]|uniref:Acetyl esterase/lipase n=1 Tax=Ruminococcus albus TaxID=1264 RepID=A0A1H7P0R7_RUMAL|nr:alpha/beta hydrolase [Ruminococcus albus]SEL29363.1 Acetyl esterase/lipase [Ruminococcus albus]